MFCFATLCSCAHYNVCAMFCIIIALKWLCHLELCTFCALCNLQASRFWAQILWKCVLQVMIHIGWLGAIKFKLLLHFNNFTNIAIVNKVFVRSWLSPSCSLCFSHWYPLSSLVTLPFQLSMSIVLISHTFCDHLKN